MFGGERNAKTNMENSDAKGEKSMKKEVLLCKRRVI